MGISKYSQLARCGRFLKAQEKFLTEGVLRWRTPKKEDSFLSQKAPQPGGQKILMDSNFVNIHSRIPSWVCARNFSLSSLHNLLLRAICQSLEVPL